MEKEQVFSRKTQSKYLSAAKIICLSFLFAVPVETFAESVKEMPAVNAVQQQGIVKGTVVDTQGEPIIGASVTIKGGTVGTITDIDGNFSLTVPAGSQIVVSFIGYTRQFVTPKAGQALKIVLKEDTKTLDEVVVVGYGTQKAKNITGSIQQISASQVEDLPVSNLADALAGQINGLSVNTGNRPGDQSSLSIRQSFNYAKDGGDSTPLVIIDDVIQIDANTGRATLEQFNLLDASEVESITVLRDASAAIYGSRASQGAIIVKTKRGKSGAPRISYSGKFAFNDAVSHSKLLNAYDYGVWANSIIKATGKSSKDPDTGLWDMNKLFSDNELNEMKKLDYNWLDEAWSSAFMMSHAVNVSGGSDRATYFAGASYYDQGANMGDQDYNKWTFRAGVDVKLTSDLKFSASVSGNQSEISKSFTKNASNLDAFGGKASEQGDYNLLHHMPRYIPWEVTLDDGQTYYTSPALGPHANSGNAASANQIASWNYFSLLDNGSGQETKAFNYSANFSMTYAIPYVKGLSIKGTYATSRSTSDSEQRQMPFTLAFLGNKLVKDGQHLYGAHTEVGEYTFKENDKSSRVAYSDVITSNRQMNFYINYDRTFGKHSVSAMASVERTDAEYTKKFYLYDNPDSPYLGTSTTAGTLNAGNSYTQKNESGTLSYLGRVQYSYADRYMLQFMFRSDASTKFAPENYWGFFPGISAGWVVSEESWFKETLPWFEYLKTRLSWGKTGKDNLGAWAWKQTYSYAADKGFQFGSNGGTLGSGLTPGKTPNRDVHWDSTTKWNLGFDTRFLDGRLSASFDFYYDRNSDILNQHMSKVVGVPITVGGSYAEENYGRIDAKGVEISLGWRDKVGQVKYNIGVDFGFNGNKVKEWPDLPVGYPSDNTTREGASTYMPSWGYRVWRGTSTGDGILRNQTDIDHYWAYLSEHAEAAGTTPKFFKITDKSQMKPGMLAYQDLHGALDADGNLGVPNGQIADKEDLDQLCKNNKTYGFTTKLGLNWKGLSWSAQISTSWGGIRTIDNYKVNVSSNQMLWSPEAYWTDMFDEESNPAGRYPNAGYNGDANVIAQSDFWTISTFRCYIRNMSVGYSLPKKWLQPAKIESAKISLTGNNLWDFYNPYPKKYRNMYDSSTSMYPTLRTWSIGINLSF